MQHVVVYREAGRFAGWPANHGVWSWGDEIVVGFQTGFFRIIGERNHAIDKEKPRTNHFARSTDGGLTWRIETPPLFQDPLPAPVATNPAVDFAAPGLAVACRNTAEAPGAFLFFLSGDRCRSWRGPYQARIFDERRIDPRTDYLVQGPSSCLIFLTAAKDDQKEGRVCCARTDDGGRTWRFVSWIGEERAGFSIMPSTVRLAEHEILTAARWQQAERWGIDLFRSSDDARSWQPAGTPVEGPGLSNPPSMIRLSDGRLCLTYGCRSAPWGVRARISADGGRTWGPEIVLRGDGGHWDLGYPRTVERADGSIVTVYYFCRSADTERSIEATIWRAP